ncbi:MAG: Oligopeptide ABC transporter, periplasmic oligopeptide-binding protein OppA [uncultured Solirubrobacteraceae bacterium]|uniref:Oligopeptide ABC transporter, periplasmic oligopeptide-binding protein OppA n=1 Tax=uncultured Solirubrobacteraceae bacterium TaxID=1162706 RepID=A0A6J4SKL2_9ACTN|nr:MAG: Oligopeptide ABC transporter, periplasmic oligopeptide-binding protein OppA [uncultured Solirubrobacteraceae bacterium]
MLLVVTLGGALSRPPAAAGQSDPDVLRLPFPQYDGTLTPYTFQLGYPLVTLVYDTLMWRDANGIPRPWLARSVTRSQDGRRVTVTLRPGVRWHDGRPVTAADVAFTFRYMAARPQPRFTPQLAGVRRVRATGRLTATIDLRRASLGFEDQPLADVPMLPRHLWQGVPEGRTPAGLPVGSGPYRLVSARERSGYRLRANRDYFKGTPRVREVRVPIIDDAERTYAALRERKVDMVPLSLPRESADDLDATLGIDLARGPSYVGTTLLLNVRRAPFDSVAARRAVATALDLGRIARNVAPAEPADEGFVHPASRWSAAARVHRFDLPAARKAVRSLRLPRLRIMAPRNDPSRLEAGRQVVLALERAGVRATLVEVPGRQLGRAIGEEGVPPNFEAAIQSIPPLVSYDPDYLRVLFGSDARSAPLNFSGYRSPAFDALARRVASASDRAERRVAVRAELRLLARDAPSIPLLFSRGTYAYRSSVYNRWLFVKGTGILDKRSFLPGETQAAQAPRPDGREVGRQVEPAASESGVSVLNVISLVVLAGVVLLAGVALGQAVSRPKA